MFVGEDDGYTNGIGFQTGDLWVGTTSYKMNRCLDTARQTRKLFKSYGPIFGFDVIALGALSAGTIQIRCTSRACGTLGIESGILSCDIQFTG